jgi:hypothetical protein
MPSELGGAAIVANPFGPELKCLAIAASLHDEFMAPRRFPEFFVESVARRLWSGQSRRHVRRRLAFGV